MRGGTIVKMMHEHIVHLHGNSVSDLSSSSDVVFCTNTRIATYDI